MLPAGGLGAPTRQWYVSCRFAGSLRAGAFATAHRMSAGLCGMCLCCVGASGWRHRGCIVPRAVTQSGAPEVGRSDCLKHVELVWIIEGPLL